MEAIAHIRSSFDGKFGIPRQSGLAPHTVARIVFEPRYGNPDALRGLEGFDYIWLIWEFSQTGPIWQPTVRPPRLGGNRRMGVFATRSPFRPNPLGLSCVRLLRVIPNSPEGPQLEVAGADLMDGTPILDIKPYVSYCDAHPDAACGWVDEAPMKRLVLRWEADAPESIKSALEEVLSLDPRPAYIDDPDREFALSYEGRTVRFHVDGNILTVNEITND